MRFFLIAATLFLAFSNGFCQTTPPPGECQCILNNLWVDVYLIIDDSSQMGSAGLLEVASNVNSVFGYTQIRVGSDYPDKRGVRVSVITYNLYATIRANLSDFNSADELTSMVYSLKPNKSYDSNLQSPLKLLKDMMAYNDQNGPRNNTRSVAIIYAADYYDYDEPTIAQLGYELKANGLTIITVADVTRNNDNQIGHLRNLASDGDGFNINDDYVSEEVQQAMCRANCFCPHLFRKYVTSNNVTTGTCVRINYQQLSWTNAKFFCQNLYRQSHLVTEYTMDKHMFNQNLFETLSAQPKPFKYHIGLHYVNNGYFWEQSADLPLIPLTNPIFSLNSKPATTQQCVENVEDMSTTQMTWQNENCFTELKSSMCEVPVCDTENYCS